MIFLIFTKIIKLYIKIISAKLQIKLFFSIYLTYWNIFNN